MRIENILQTLSTQFLQKKGAGNKTQAVNSNEDKVEISSEAREMQKNQGVNNTNKVESSKEDKIREVRQKIENNFYSSPQIISKIADNILKRFNI